MSFQLQDYKKQRDLEEQRRTGKLSEELKNDALKDFNPYLPLYIAKAPWYSDEANAHKPQKDQQKSLYDADWYQRGKKGFQATKYRKGACVNCGAMTHHAKDCLEKPRKKGAKWTGKDIQADEVVQKVELGFDGKRDRWNGYDSRNHLQLAAEFEIAEQKRKLIREQKKKDRVEKKLNAESDDSSDDEKYAHQAPAVGQKVDWIDRSTVRNLRQREDTAKYLKNLDPNSAEYDPKTRSMHENPHSNLDPTQASFAGDDFVRYTGEVVERAHLQSFAWEAEEKGVDGSHMQANPTQVELMYKKYKQNNFTLNTEEKQSILSKYGGEENLKSIPKELLLAQTENYVEYSADGQVVKGQEAPVMKSKYPEDM